MDEKAPLDDHLLNKLDRFREIWPDYRNDLTHTIFFSLAVIALIFFNLEALDLVASSPVIKVIDVFALLILFIVPNWAYVERSQGDKMQQILWDIDEGEINVKDSETMDKLQGAAAYFDTAERGYPFILLMSGMGIIALNIIAYIVYGSAPG